MRYLSIDTETTGLDYSKCSMIELAMVLEDTEALDWRKEGMAPGVLPSVETLPAFHCVVLHPKGCFWENFPLNMHKDRLLKAIYGCKSGDVFRGVVALNFEDAISEAEIWLKRRGITQNDQITVAGKNFAGFDYHFLPPVITRCFSRRVLDPGSVFVDWNKQRLPSLGELKGDTVSHNALDDALDVIRVLRKAYR